MHNNRRWSVEFFEAFEVEFHSLKEEVQVQLLAHAKLLEEFGSLLGRPHVDTLKDSAHPNLKELRFDADGGVWRVAFAFDPERKAILLVAGDKSGGSKRSFYKQHIAKADSRFNEHLTKLMKSQKIKR